MRARLINLGVVSALLLGATVWWFAFNGVNPALIVFPPPEPPPPPAAFDKLVDVSFTDEPFFEVLERLAKQHDLKLVLERSQIRNALGIVGDEPVSLNLKDIRLRQVFEAVMYQIDSSLVVVAHEGHVLITHVSNWYDNQSRYVSRVYPLNPLLASDTSTDEADLAELVTSMIHPESWDIVGGLGVCEIYPGGLVVAQTPDVQQRIERFLGELRQELSPTRPIAFQDDVLERNAQVERRLAEVVTAEFSSATVGDAVAYLAKQAGVNLIVDVESLEQEGIALDSTLVSKSLINVSYGGAVRWLLSRVELTSFVRDGGLLVTTEAAASEQYHQLRVYHAADVIPDGDGDSLIELVTAVVEPSDWDEVGGNGQVAVFDGKLVVSHYATVQQQVYELLRMLRAARRQSTVVRPHRSKEAAKIASVLDRPSTILLEKASLDEIADAVSRQYGVNVETAPVRLMRPLTIRPAETLRQALNACMSEYEGRCLLHGDSLLLAVDEDRRIQMELRVFPLREFYDLYGRSFNGDSLIDVLTSMIDPDHWSDVGGEADLRMIGSHLVVRNLPESLDSIETLMTAIGDALTGDSLEPLIVFPAEPKLKEMHDRLAQRVTMSFDQAPMEHVIDTIRGKFATPVSLDSRKQEQGGVRLFEPVSGEVKDLRLRSALGLILGNMGMSFMVTEKDDVTSVFISRYFATGFDDWTELRIYSVADMSLDMDFSNSLSHAIRELGGNQRAWTDYGGPGEAVATGPLLVVRHTPDMHRRIETLLAELRAAGKDNSDKARQILSPDETERRVQKALEQPVNVRLDGETCGAVVARLANRFDLPLWICPSVREVISRHKTKYNAIFHQAPLGTVLDFLVEQLQLEQSIVFERLVIGATDAFVAPDVRLYPIGDLERAANPDAEFVPAALSDPMPQMDLFLALLRDASVPFVGSPKSGVSSPIELGDTYFVSGPRRQHNEVAEALRRYRAARRADMSQGPLDRAAIPRANYRANKMPARELLIELAKSAEASLWIDSDVDEWLSGEVSCDFLDQPLDQCVELVRKKVDESEEATEPLYQVYADRGVWVVAPPSTAAEAMETRMYRLSSSWNSNAIPQTELLKLTISPFSWGDLGGAASLFVSDDVAIVTQSLANHHRLERLLEMFDGFPTVADADRHINSQDPLMRAASQLTLAVGEKTSKNAEILTRSLAKATDNEDRFRICYALRRHKEKAGEAAPLLFGLLGETDWRMRTCYYATLVELGPPAGPYLARTAKTIKYNEYSFVCGKAEQLKERGEHLLPLLLALQANQQYQTLGYVQLIDADGSRSLKIAREWMRSDDVPLKENAAKLESQVIAAFKGFN